MAGPWRATLASLTALLACCHLAAGYTLDCDNLPTDVFMHKRVVTVSNTDELTVRLQPYPKQFHPLLVVKSPHNLHPMELHACRVRLTVLCRVI